MQHHAFVVEAGAEEGISAALAFLEQEFDMRPDGNPDLVVLRHGLLSVEDARKVTELAAGAPFSGEHKAIIIAAHRIYHEAQNALLKVFEEPPIGTYLFLVVPTTGGLLPTLLSRVQRLDAGQDPSGVSEAARTFIKANRAKRSELIKKLSVGKDEDARRAARDEALAIANGIEAAVYSNERDRISLKGRALLEEVAALRGYLHDRSAPVKMILEHLALVTPANLI